MSMSERTVAMECGHGSSKDGGDSRPPVTSVLHPTPHTPTQLLCLHVSWCSSGRLNPGSLSMPFAAPCPSRGNEVCTPSFAASALLRRQQNLVYMGLGPVTGLQEDVTPTAKGPATLPRVSVSRPRRASQMLTPGALPGKWGH